MTVDKYDESKFVNDHCYIFCAKLGQRRNTQCCTTLCADKGDHYTDKWKDKYRDKCKNFQLWLPEELRTKVKKRGRKKKGVKAKSVINTGNITVDIKSLKKEGRGRPSKQEVMDAASCAVVYMAKTSCSPDKAAEYVATKCRLTADTIKKNISKVIC